MAGLKTQSSCVRLADLYGDGDSKLLVVRGAPAPGVDVLELLLAVPADAGRRTGCCLPPYLTAVPPSPPLIL